jgi:hypothetical protein
MTKLRKVNKPTLLTVGEKQFISNGRWNDDLMVNYVLERGQKKWLPIQKIAAIAYCSGSLANQNKARKNLHKLIAAALMHEILIVIAYSGPHGSATGVKVLDPASEADRQLWELRFDRMVKRNALTSDQVRRAAELWRQVTTAVAA